MILSERKSFGVVQLKLSTDAPPTALLCTAQPVVDVELSVQPLEVADGCQQQESLPE
jgi:hypothetical protein